jgi:hypothetical protein
MNNLAAGVYSIDVPEVDYRTVDIVMHDGRKYVADVEIIWDNNGWDFEIKTLKTAGDARVISCEELTCLDCREINNTIEGALE